MVPAAAAAEVNAEELDPEFILAFLGLLAAFMAGAELSQMRKAKWLRPDHKGAALAGVLLLAALFLMWWFGDASPP